MQRERAHNRYFRALNVHNLETYSNVEQIKNVLNSAPQTPMAMAKNIYTDLPPMFLPVASKQVECHLEYLEEIHWVQRTSSGWMLKP